MTPESADSELTLIPALNQRNRDKNLCMPLLSWLEQQEKVVVGAEVSQWLDIVA